MDQDCPFCRIIRGEDEGQVVYEGEQCIAFLDRRPVFPGHCLVIPRQHYEILPDLPPDLLEPFFSAVQIICRAMERGLGADGSLVAVNNRVSQSVAHVHVHVVPRRRGDGLKSLFWPRQEYESEQQRRQVRDALRRAVEELRGEA